MNVKGNEPLIVQLGDDLNKIYNDGYVDLASGYWVWEDLRYPASSIFIPGQPSDPDFIVLTGNIRVLGFDQTTDEQVFFQAQMSHGWVSGSAIHPHVHWCPLDSENGVDVVWGLEYAISSPGQVLSAPVTIYASGSEQGDVNLTGYKHYITDFPAIDMTSYSGLSTILDCRLFRNASNETDSYTNDVALHEADIHYQIDTMGSRQEFSKQ